MLRDRYNRVLSASPVVEENEVVRDLKSDDFSRRLEAEASEPERDLNHEACSTKPEAELSAPVKALKNE